MNRRQFTTALTALFAAPALPSMATAAAPSAANIKVASIIARSHNRCSPEMLARLMRLDMGAATGLHNTLLRQGVIMSAPVGPAMATNPTNTHCITNEALRPSNMLQKLAKLKEQADEFLSDDGAPEVEDQTDPTRE